MEIVWNSVQFISYFRYSFFFVQFVFTELENILIYLYQLFYFMILNAFTA